MISKQILNIGTLAILLSTIAVGSEQSDCPGGACFAILDDIKSSQGVEQTKEIKYIEEYNLNTEIDKSIAIILDGERVSVFPESSYFMNENEEVDFDSLIVTETLEDKILEKITLPNSEYYCENNKVALFNKYVDIYECV